VLSFHLEFRIVFCHMNAVKEFAANLQWRFVIRSRFGLLSEDLRYGQARPKNCK
jgi:hypothetical protein